MVYKAMGDYSVDAATSGLLIDMTQNPRKSSVGTKDQKWEGCRVKSGLIIFLEIIVISSACFQ